MRKLALALLPLAACTATDDSARLARGDAVYLETIDVAHPRLRYADGQVSRNDSCIVRVGNKLNHRIPPLYVNGAPVGFC